MGLFGKKKRKNKEDNSEELPPLPSDMSSNPSQKGQEKEELPQLPSFPSSKTGNKVSNHAAKQAIGKPRQEENKDTHQPQKPLSSAETEKINSQVNKKRTQEIGGEFGNIKPPQARVSPNQSPEKDGPVYVSLDNFEDSKKEFEKIKELVQEVDKKLKEDIKELKKKEEKDIEKWEEEIEEAKSLLEKIDSSIFSNSK